MRLVNLTPTPIGLCDRKGQVRWYEPSGIVPQIIARESEQLDPDAIHEVRILARVEVIGLPAAHPEGFIHPEGPTLYIVEPLIAHLCGQQRWDLCSVDPTSTIGPGVNTGLVYYRRLISWDLSDRVGLAHSQPMEA